MIATGNSRIWLIKFSVALALLWTCCWAAPRLFGTYPQFRPATTGQLQEEIFDRYFKLPLPNVVIVGSSLAWHVKDWYFERGDVRNVAIPGGSSLTSLAIIAAAPSARPRAIAVETNILDRSMDNDLVEKFGNVRRPQRPLPLMRTLAAWYEGARDGTLPYDREKIQSIIASPPAPDRSKASVATSWDDWNRVLDHRIMLEHAELLRSLTVKLEALGVRVFFFEVPYPSQLNESRYAVTSREVLAEVFPPDDQRRLVLSYPVSEMRSEADGVHLDDRSSVIFAAALDEAIHERLANGRWRRWRLPQR
jgi:hypothetical protein